VVVVPIYNPAAGFRSPELSATIAYDFAQLETVLNGEVSPRILYDDPIPNPVYEEVINAEQIDAVMLDATRISTDTEGYDYAPWSAQITTHDGHAYVIRYEINGRRNPLLGHFVAWVNANRDQYVFVFHNALHDLAVFRAIGIETDRLKFHDTMLMSYALQLEPQGLKPLCARWCNMKMEHYDEVMGDVSFRLAQDWLLSSMENEELAYEVRCHDEFTRLCTTPFVNKAGKTVPGRKLKVPPKLPKSGLHKSIERCLRSARPRKLWDDQVIDLHVEAEGKYGPIWVGTLDHVPLPRAIGYAGRDSDGTHRLAPCLEERLRANDLWPVYQADLRTVPLIDRMQQTGIRPNLAHFDSLSTDLGFELVEIRTRLAEQLVTLGALPLDDAFAFNPNGRDQVAQLLFERFGIASLKRTPGGDDSTNDKVLEALEKDHSLDRGIRDVVAVIREYRETYKLKSTFVDAIPDFVHRWPHDGRIHATFRITRVVTGRLACSDPNLLALPKHGKFAHRFRQGFIAGDGHKICSWDLSQIELRVLAHLSQDPVLLNAFRTGVDLHATLAQRIFGVAPKDQDKSKHRLPAKAVNFGIPMGMTNIGLCLELRKNGVDIDEADAQRWLDETMALYARVPVYQQDKIAEAKRCGFVVDLNGRRRYIGGIRSYDDATRSEAERFAFSTPIQAGAQSVMKEAEAYVYTDILLPAWARGDYLEPLIQIHDDLVLESAAERVPELDRQMQYAMTKIPAHYLSVPIETSGEAGDNWGDMHEIVLEGQ
jgi:DNA polymerase I-like protein with 3'-5' exonuclease and polymerase domains